MRSFGVSFTTSTGYNSISFDGREPYLIPDLENDTDIQKAVFVCSHSVGVNIVDEDRNSVVTFFNTETMEYDTEEVRFVDSDIYLPMGELIFDIENKKIYHNDDDITERVLLGYSDTLLVSIFDNVSGLTFS